MTSHRIKPRRAVKRGLIVVAVGAAAVTGGFAYAAWTSSGEGSGQAQGGSASAPTTSGYTGTVAGTLVPGGTGDLVLVVNNPNPYPVKVTSVGPRQAAVAVDEAHSTGCVTTGVTVLAQAPTADNAIDANGTATLTLAGAVKMGNGSDNGCQGATFTVPVSITLESNAG